MPEHVNAANPTLAELLLCFFGLAWVHCTVCMCDRQTRHSMALNSHIHRIGGLHSAIRTPAQSCRAGTATHLVRSIRKKVGLLRALQNH